MGQHEQRHTFKIAEAFPPDNVDARFVTVLAMIHNEWLRSMKVLQDSLEHEAEEAQGIRLLFTRQQFAGYHEAVTFINESRAHYHPDIDNFIDSLGEVGREHYDTLMAPLAEFERCSRRTATSRSTIRG